MGTRKGLFFWKNMAIDKLELLLAIHENPEGGFSAALKDSRGGEDSSIYCVDGIEDLVTVDSERALIVKTQVLQTRAKQKEEGSHSKKVQVARVPVIVNSTLLNLDCPPGTPIIRDRRLVYPLSVLRAKIA
jgi:hypothetical protein